MKGTTLERGPSGGAPAPELSDAHQEILGAADPTIGELPVSPASGEELGSSMEDMLASLDAEARVIMEGHLREMGGPLVRAEDELAPIAFSGIDQLQALVDDPASHPSERAIKTETTPRTLNEDELEAINKNLANFGKDTAVDTAAEAAPTVIEEATKTERPISTRSFIVEKPAPIDAEGTAPVVTSKLGKFVEKVAKKVTDVAERVEGAADIRRDTKHMIETQRAELGKVVDKTRSESVAARKTRNSVLIHNNAFARRLGSDNRGKLKALKEERIDAKYNAIDAARKLKNEKRNRDPDATSKTDSLRRFGARITSGFEARAMRKASAVAEISRTRKERDAARTEHDRQKARRASLRRGVFHSGRTLSGAVDSRIGSFSRAGLAAEKVARDSRKTEAQRKTEAEARAKAFADKQKAALKKRGIDARKRWEDRNPVYGPPKPE